MVSVSGSCGLAEAELGERHLRGLVILVRGAAETQRKVGPSGFKAPEALALPENSAPYGSSYGMRSIVHPKFGEHALEVGFHCVFGETKLSRDGLVRIAI
jgi:hypothetical protein